MRGITLNDVAKLACQHLGRKYISVRTVCSALHGKEGVNPTMAKVIRNSAEELGYSSKSVDVGFIIASVPMPHCDFYLGALQVANQSLLSKELNLYILFPQDFQQEITDMRRFYKQGAYGFIACGSRMKRDLIYSSANEEFPVVALDMPDMNPCKSVCVVNVSYRKGAYRLAQHLLTRGHTKSVYIGPVESRINREFLDGLNEAFSGFGRLEDIQRFDGDDYSLGYFACKELLDYEHRTTALIAYNTKIAVGAVSALNEKGLKAPLDMAVVACDDSDIAKYSNPRLTTVGVQPQRLGRVLADILTGMIYQDSEGRMVEIEPELSIRESS